MRIILLLALSGSLLHADTLADLKARLATLDGREAVTAAVEYEFSNRAGDDDTPVKRQGKSSALVEDGPDGIRITWPRELIATADREATDKNEDATQKADTRRAIGAIGPMMVHDHLNAAAGFLRTLEQAEFIEEKADSWEGQPARLLVMKLPPPQNPQARKYLKEWNGTAKVWVGPGGLPLAAEMRRHQKGRALLVVSFEGDDNEDMRYAAVGGRLVILRHTKEGGGSGAGQSNHDTSLTTVRLQKAVDS
jgi:hypothetical protein